MDLKLPEDIYLRISEQIDAIVVSLKALSVDGEIADAKQQALKTFSRIGSEVNEHVAALGKNAEWGIFTIAFYGETNAGKSTLIETLRILLNEPEKIRMRSEFTALRQKFNITDEHVVAMRSLLAQYDEQCVGLQHRAEELARESGKQVQVLTSQASELKQKIERKVQTSLWQKLLRMLGRLPEQQQLVDVEQALQAMKVQRQATLAIHNKEMQIAVQARDEQQRKLVDIEAALARLSSLGDGAIIGTGRSDFTMDTQDYRFDSGEAQFALLDVPGIEGSEGKVKNEILAAVQKAHAVFYVTGKPTAPQQGGDNHEGTLQKIKRHLNAQTEVWTIYNKRVTNPLPFKQAELINEGERESLKDLDQKMAEQLGEHYRGTVTVSALPAFLVIAECLPPDSSHLGGRAKFLASHDQDTILEKSGLSAFKQMLLGDFVKGYKQKIRRSNFNKANQVVIEAGQSVDTLLKNSFRPLATRLTRNATQFGKQLDTAFEALKSRLDAQGQAAVSDFVSTVRKNMYESIDDDLSNDDFKHLFTRVLERQQSDLAGQLPQVMQGEVEKFEEQIREIMERQQELTSELVNSYNSIGFNALGEPITLKIEIDSGINIAGLAGALAGGLLMFWNPAGWVVLALGALTVLVGAVKAVMGFFSSDYKKTQQRKAVSSNLSEIEKKMRRALQDSLDEALPKLEPKLEDIRQALRIPGEQVGKVVMLLTHAERQLNKISKTIETRGAL